MSVFRTVRATATARTQNGLRRKSGKKIKILRESLHARRRIRPPLVERRLKCFRPFVGRKSHVSYFVRRTRSTLYISPPPPDLAVRTSRGLSGVLTTTRGGYTPLNAGEERRQTGRRSFPSRNRARASRPWRVADRIIRGQFRRRFP